MCAHVCPWWGGYFIDNPWRRLLHDPQQLLGPHVQPGMTVLDVGCGMGFFAIAMAKMVAERGRVIALDVQQQMLDVLARRAARAGLSDRIQARRCAPDRLDVDASVDVALAFAVIHEVPDARRLMGEVHDCLTPGGKFLVAEPKLHVTGRRFESLEIMAAESGFQLSDRPHVRLCHAALWIKPASASAGVKPGK